MTLKAFIAWAKMVGAYQVLDAFERFKKYREATDGRKEQDTNKG